MPTGALVRWRNAYFIRIDDLGEIVGCVGLETWMSWKGGGWTWGDGCEPATIVALGITGQEPPATLKRLAETFEVEQALRTWTPDDWRRPKSTWTTSHWDPQPLRWYAEQLHAHGWRPGQTVGQAREAFR